MAKFGKTLEFRNLNEKKTLTGKSFLIYGESASRKTRTLGSLPGATFHVSLDSGAETAQAAADMLEMTDAEHYEVRIDTLQEIMEFINTCKTTKNIQDKFDTVVLDNLVEVTAQIYTNIAQSPRFKNDQLALEDVIDPNSKKNATSSKMQALYKEAQEKTRYLVKEFLSLTNYFNVIVLTNYVEVPTAKAIESGVYPMVNGPSSIRPLIMLFSECYSTSFKDGIFDSKDKIETKFKIGTYNCTLTGKRWFGKTRCIQTLKYLQSNEIPADFRLIFKETGYVLKKDRK